MIYTIALSRVFLSGVFLSGRVQGRPLWSLLRTPRTRPARSGAWQPPAPCWLGTYRRTWGGKWLAARVRGPWRRGARSADAAGQLRVWRQTPTSALITSNLTAPCCLGRPLPATRSFAARGRGALIRRPNIVLARGPQSTRRRPESRMHHSSDPPPARATNSDPRPEPRLRGSPRKPLGARRHAGEHRFRTLAAPRSRTVHV